MGEQSPRRGFARRAKRAWAALPFAAALALAAGTLNASLAPAPGAEELRFAHPPPAPAAAPAGPAHHEAPLYDPDEPVSV
jgi:hypothetical protein